MVEPPKKCRPSRSIRVREAFHPGRSSRGNSGFIAAAIASFAILIFLPLDAHATRSVIGCPGKNYTLSRGVNVNAEICVRMYNYKNGVPATAKFWNIGLIGNEQLGRHSGSACFKLKGIKYELRVGHIQSATIFYVFAGRTSVYRSFKFDFDALLGNPPPQQSARQRSIQTNPQPPQNKEPHGTPPQIASPRLQFDPCERKQGGNTLGGGSPRFR